MLIRRSNFFFNFFFFFFFLIKKCQWILLWKTSNTTTILENRICNTPRFSYIKFLKKSFSCLSLKVFSNTFVKSRNQKHYLNCIRIKINHTENQILITYVAAVVRKKRKERENNMIHLHEKIRQSFTVELLKKILWSK